MTLAEMVLLECLQIRRLTSNVVSLCLTVDNFADGKLKTRTLTVDQFEGKKELE